MTVSGLSSSASESGLRSLMQTAAEEPLRVEFLSSEPGLLKAQLMGRVRGPTHRTLGTAMEWARIGSTDVGGTARRGAQEGWDEHRQKRFPTKLRSHSRKSEMGGGPIMYLGTWKVGGKPQKITKPQQTIQSPNRLYKAPNHNTNV